VPIFPFDRLILTLQKYDVDLALYGHVHRYERTCGMYNFTCADEDSDATVHVVIGMAGNVYQTPYQSNLVNNPLGYSQWELDEPYWCVFRSGQFGYAHIHANATALVFTFLGDSRNDIHDTFTLYK